MDIKNSSNRQKNSSNGHKINVDNFELYYIL